MWSLGENIEALALLVFSSKQLEHSKEKLCFSSSAQGPNSTNLFNRIKEKLKNNLDIKSNRINLINISEINFLNKIDLINEEKKII